VINTNELIIDWERTNWTWGKKNKQGMKKNIIIENLFFFEVKKQNHNQ
jgi:hypothetical protein